MINYGIPKKKHLKKAPFGVGSIFFSSEIFEVMVATI